nr:phage major tail tube protein [Rhodoplanes tepidamans]
MEAANLYCGDDDPTKSKHLTISNLRLPSLEELFQDHHPGGSRVAIEVEVGIKKLEPTFKLVGFDPDLLAQFGLGSRARRVFTAYRVIRDKLSGLAIEHKAIMEGRLGKITEDEFKRGDLAGADYAINEVYHYEIWFDRKEVLYWDFKTQTHRVNGEEPYRTENAILRIPGTV